VKEVRTTLKISKISIKYYLYNPFLPLLLLFTSKNMDLVGIFWNYCHTLRHEGVDYADYIEELTYLLFLKLASERKVEIPVGCSWNELISQKDEALLLKYNQVLATLSKEKNTLGDIFTQPMAKIRNANSLNKLLMLIESINWQQFDADILGAMFEGLLEKAASESKKGTGQYFTPRPLIETIVKVMQPDPFENENFNITDVACGTGGFLISSLDWARLKYPSKNLTSKEKLKLHSDTYFGQELVIRPRRLAQMNLFLHEVQPNITLGDTIYEPFNGTKFSCILSNPPFGNKGTSEIPDRVDFPIKTSNKQLNFIQHIVSCLKDGGRAAIVLPDNVLFEDKASELWKAIFPNCNFHTILRLPNGTFSPYANVKANVLFCQKGLPTKEVWIYDARKDVEVITKNNRPLTSHHFEGFLNFYGQDPNGTKKQTLHHTKANCYSLKEIEENSYKLNFSNEEDLQHSEASIEILYNGLDLLIEDIENIAEDLKELVNTIRGYDE
jgi:type I restriction enzyme M protein